MNGATPVRSITFDYYRDGQLKSADDDGAEGRDYDWIYDAMGRLKETKWRAADQIVPYDYTLANKYDANSRRTERIVHVDPDAPFSPVDVLLDWWYYDDLGRVVDQYQRDNLFNWRRATYTYFADGQLDTMDRYTYDSPNWTKLLTTEWTYDGAGRIDDLKHFKANGTTLLAGYDYGFDAAGRMTSMDFLNSTYNVEDVTTFGYDRTNQLLSGERTGTSNDEAYAYDGAGNRASANGSTYTTTSNNRLTNDGTFTYTYDDEGNRLTKVRISGAAADDKTVEYTWDYRNRLEKVTFKRNDGTVTKRVENYYDMFNRWTKRVLDHDGDTGSATPRVDRLIYDGDVLIQDFTEYSDSHTFMHGPLPDMVIFDYHENELRIPLGDHLNTIRDVVAHDGTDWNIVNHVTIDSFGRRLDESDDTIEVFHGLGGRPYDEETGLQNHLHRWYDPATGRWTSEDPIGFGGGHASLNAYTGNSPVNGVDPSGLVPGGWGAQEIATWKARRFEEVSQIYAEAGIPIPQSVLESFGYFIPTDPKIPDGPLESVIASFSSIPTLGAAWGADWAGDDAKADELYDEAYLQSPIGQLDDSPVMQGFAVAGLVIAGTALAVAGGVIAINAFGGPTMSVTIVRGDSIIKPIHAGWRLYGPWMHAQGIFGRVLPRTMGTGGSGFWTGGPGYWNTITGIPIRNATAAAAVEGPFWNCVTAVGTVIRTGWGW